MWPFTKKKAPKRRKLWARGRGGDRFRRVGYKAFKDAPHHLMPSRQGILEAVPATLTKLFGKPEDGDDWKVSTEWVFRNELGELVSIYDFKQTSVYSDDLLLSPAKLRASKTPVEFFVGASNLEAFLDFERWLQKKGADVDIERASYLDNPAEECLGTVSFGTLRPEGLIPKLMAALDERLEASTFEEGADDPARLQQLDRVETELGEMARRIEQPNYYESGEAGYDLEFLFEQLSKYTPEGCYFGAHPSNTADFGFWPAEEED